MTRKSRPNTCKLLDMMEQGTLDPLTVAQRCLDYMSEDEVTDMAETEGFIETEEENDDEQND
jgi:hypothetical protein